MVRDQCAGFGVGGRQFDNRVNEVVVGLALFVRPDALHKIPAGWACGRSRPLRMTRAAEVRECVVHSFLPIMAHAPELSFDFWRRFSNAAPEVRCGRTTCTRHGLRRPAAFERVFLTGTLTSRVVPRDSGPDVGAPS